MVEQKPEIQTENKGETNDPQGYAERKGNFLGKVKRGISRRVIVPVSLAIGLSGAAVGCGPGEAENTTNPSGITSTQVPGTESSSTTIPYATTEGNNTTTNTTHKVITTEVSTTVSTVPETTTTTNKDQAFLNLVSKDQTIDDVKGNIPHGSEITTPINVSDKVQAEFQQIHPGRKILYIGPDNRGDENNLTGNELNDSIVTVGGLDPETDLQFLSFGGTKAFQTEKGIFFGQIAMKFIDIILIPNSKDFYVHGIDPLSNNADIYVRIVRDENSKFQQTELQCFNLNNKDGFDYGKSKNYDKKKHLASNIQPDKFFIPGDTLEFFTQFSVVQTGNTGVMTFSADEKGVQTAALAGDIRLAGADEIESLFQ